MKLCTGKEMLRPALVGAMLIIMGLAASPVMAEGQASVGEKLTEALEHYANLEPEKGIVIAKGLLERGDLTPSDSIAVYEVLSIITYVMGRDYFKESFSYLDQISKIGPCKVILPRDIWPAELRNKWFELLKATNSLSCATLAGPGVKTVAVMEFDNFSIGEYQEKLGPLGKGLADFFEHDFAKVSDVKVIERDKINFVLNELELQKSGAVDQSTAVQVGKILGAQFMIFGSITQLDDKQTRMVVRVVSVETSEIVASADKEGKPEYSKMEKELVEELAEKMDIKLSDEDKSEIKEGGTESLDATSLYAKGIEYMDRYDYSRAYDFFKKAYEMDPLFAEAKRKMEIYEPLVS
ncbi:MAG: CsgG/HfaB family protein [bacterium]